MLGPVGPQSDFRADIRLEAVKIVRSISFAYRRNLNVARVETRLSVRLQE